MKCLEESRSCSVDKASVSFYFPQRLRGLVYAAECDSFTEEIRLRVGRPIQIVTAQGERFLTGTSDTHVFTESDSAYVLAAFCEQSVYAHREELKRGFLSLPGGVRVGLAGSCVLNDNGMLQRLTDINAYNIRIAHERTDCALPLMSIIASNDRISSTLIISPPGVGKTTVLRDLSRLISDGSRYSSPKRVSLIDERGELAFCINGIPQADVGMRTDVFDGCPKAQAMSMAIRSMSPNVLITDELGSDDEALAALDAAYCGISIITSAHGATISDITRRSAIGKLLDTGVFHNVVALRRKGFKLYFDTLDIPRTKCCGVMI